MTSSVGAYSNAVSVGAAATVAQPSHSQSANGTTVISSRTRYDATPSSTSTGDTISDVLSTLLRSQDAPVSSGADAAPQASVQQLIAGFINQAAQGDFDNPHLAAQQQVIEARIAARQQQILHASPATPDTGQAGPSSGGSMGGPTSGGATGGPQPDSDPPDVGGASISNLRAENAADKLQLLQVQDQQARWRLTAVQQSFAARFPAAVQQASLVGLSQSQLQHLAASSDPDAWAKRLTVNLVEQAARVEVDSNDLQLAQARAQFDPTDTAAAQQVSALQQGYAADNAALTNLVTAYQQESSSSGKPSMLDGAVSSTGALDSHDAAVLQQAVTQESTTGDSTIVDQMVSELALNLHQVQDAVKDAREQNQKNEQDFQRRMQRVHAQKVEQKHVQQLQAQHQQQMQQAQAVAAAKRHAQAEQLGLVPRN